MSRPPRRRRDPALLRARYRTLFFLLLTALALALGQRAAAAPALAGALIGVYSAPRGAQAPGRARAHLRRPRLGAPRHRTRPLRRRRELAARRGAVPGHGPAGRSAARRVAVPRRAVAPARGHPRDRRPVARRQPLPLRRQGGRARRRRLRRGDPAPAWPRGRRAGAGRTRPRSTSAPDSPHSPACRTSWTPVLRSRSTSTGRSAWCTCGWSTTRTAATSSAPSGSEELVRGVARRAERRLGADERAFRVRPDSVRAGPARPLARRGARGSRRVRARRQRAASSPGAGRRWPPAPPRSRRCGASRTSSPRRATRPRRYPAAARRGWRVAGDGRTAGAAAPVTRRAATARVLPLPMRLASLRLWRSTSPTSRSPRASPCASGCGSRGVRPAGSS